MTRRMQPEQPGAPKGWSARIWLEILLLTAGLALLAGFAAARIDGYLSSRAAVKRFSAGASLAAPDSGRAATAPADPKAKPTLEINEDVSASALTRADPGGVMAVLRIPNIHLEVPVFAGTDALTLNRGAGWIAWTSPPGEGGNTGLAAHRDSFFRGLKDVKVGDAIHLETHRSDAAYIVDRIRIVNPEDVSVLDRGPTPQLTLVTCYPFHYIGNAPKRYVVTARSIETPPSLPGQPRS